MMAAAAVGAPADYEAFLATKVLVDAPSGIDVAAEALPGGLFPFQQSLVRWALRRGRAGLFTGTGTGKTRMQLAWARHIPGRVLLLAPLAVTHQTIREAALMDLEPVQYVRHPREMQARICITNYDMLEHFVGLEIAGVVLDEASIIKSFSGATRKMLVEQCAYMPYRLACTATPAPNSTEEIGNYAEWLGVLTLNDMRAMFFVHDEQGWRLMPHARQAFYRWLSSWAMTMRGPADLGFDAEGFDLPPLEIVEHFLPWDDTRLVANGDGQMGIPGLQRLHGITDRLAVRQQTIGLRAATAASLAREAEGQVVIWCGLNEESAMLARCLDGSNAVEIRGSDSREEKERRLLGFMQGEYRILITKVAVAGFGCNLQMAHTAIFCGLNDSWEGWYQAVRRLWRYGQRQAVTTHVVLSEQERPIWDNVQAKEREATQMIDGLIAEIHDYEEEALGLRQHGVRDVQPTMHAGDNWMLYHGDCVEGLRCLADDSIALAVTSPPFGNLFQYNASERDIGNTRGSEQFFAHHHFLTQELLRVMQPGRLIAMHVMQVPAMLVRDGYIGLHDFRGQMIAHMQEHGFIYAGEVTCAKSPQAQAIRIRAKGLAFNQLHKDSAWSRPALNDYILLFRKPGENAVPVNPDIDNETWIVWASGIWVSTYYDSEDGYRETYTLNVAEGRDEDDTKHICPLPLDLVERCIRLWSNPGETVLDPFSGLGTVGVKAVEHGRRYLGCELKDSYVRASLTNLARATQVTTQQSLF